MYLYITCSCPPPSVDNSDPYVASPTSNPATAGKIQAR